MAKRPLNTVTIALCLLLALSQSYTARATNHVVGNYLGWVIPPFENAYSAWAATRTFLLGDSLEFVFITGIHNVAEVSKQNFYACNSTHISSIKAKGPVFFNLSSTGEHYFTSTLDGHCQAGQKLAILVTEFPSPSPSFLPLFSLSPFPPPIPPLTNPPPLTPRAPTTHNVGELVGWMAPAYAGFPGSLYKRWAANKSFIIGDTLIFKYEGEVHNVAEVTKAGYLTCNASYVKKLHSEPPTVISLNATGDRFFICTFATHCMNGQKLAISVSGSYSPSLLSSSLTPALAPSNPVKSGSIRDLDPVNNVFMSSFVTLICLVFISCVL